MENTTFDAIAYFEQMTLHCKFAVDNNFVPVVISSVDELGSLLERYRTNDRFVAITDTNSGNLSSADGQYGFFKRRAFTVFIIAAYDYNDMEDWKMKMGICRTLFYQFCSRILRDKYEYDEKQMYFETRTFANQELGQSLLSGMTGLHFTLYEQEPIDLIYDETQWL